MSGGNLAVEGQSGLERQLESLAIHHRQTAGQAQADRTRLHVRLRRVETIDAAAEEFRSRKKLDVHFKSDDGGVIHRPTLQRRPLGVPRSLALEHPGRAKQRFLGKRGPEQLNADRQAARAESARQRNPRQPARFALKV